MTPGEPHDPLQPEGAAATDSQRLAAASASASGEFNVARLVDERFAQKAIDEIRDALRDIQARLREIEREQRSRNDAVDQLRTDQRAANATVDRLQADQRELRERLQRLVAAVQQHPRGRGGGAVWRPPASVFPAAGEMLPPAIAGHPEERGGVLAALITLLILAGLIILQSGGLHHLLPAPAAPDDQSPAAHPTR